MINNSEITIYWYKEFIKKNKINYVYKQTTVFFYKFFNFNFFKEELPNKKSFTLLNFFYNSSLSAIMYLNIKYFYKNLIFFTNLIFFNSLNCKYIYVYGRQNFLINSYLYFLTKMLFYTKKKKKKNIFMVFFFDVLYHNKIERLHKMIHSKYVSIGFITLNNKINYNYDVPIYLPVENNVYKYMYLLYFLNILFAAIKFRKIHNLYKYMQYYKKLLNLFLIK